MTRLRSIHKNICKIEAFGGDNSKFFCVVYCLFLYCIPRELTEARFGAKRRKAVKRLLFLSSPNKKKRFKSLQMCKNHKSSLLPDFVLFLKNPYDSRFYRLPVTSV